MTAAKITQEQFRESLEEFFKWVSPHNKTRTEWLLTLENWAKWQYNVAYAKEQKARTS
ncbi:hypothetical protein LCGC14_0430230 [marine sediment metagenome]|uniref:Uncharacterized protein n=1 Tax=marine sediment metagenome TaxID=412755 RepID=A0A0F9T6P3_9ZZZZ